MKIPKAIEILTDELRHAPCLVEPDIKDATKLGREALKAIKESRRLWGDRGVGKLPGETKE